MLLAGGRILIHLEAIGTHAELPQQRVAYVLKLAEHLVFVFLKPLWSHFRDGTWKTRPVLSRIQEFLARICAICNRSVSGSKPSFEFEASKFSALRKF